MRIPVFSLALLCTVCTAQTPTPLPTLEQYLSLTEAQMTAINENNQAYNITSQAKQLRLTAVGNEIVDETGKSPLSPQDLGARYAEVETICRELTEEGKKVRARNLAVLNDAQKARLKALEDALAIVALGVTARNVGLAELQNPVSSFTSEFRTPPSNAVGGVAGVGLLTGPQTVFGCLLTPLGLPTRIRTP